MLHCCVRTISFEKKAQPIFKRLHFGLLEQNPYNPIFANCSYLPSVLFKYCPLDIIFGPAV